VAAQHAHPADAPAGAIKIVGFLKNAFPIYQYRSRRGAADAQDVSRQLISVVLIYSHFCAIINASIGLSS